MTRSDRRRPLVAAAAAALAVGVLLAGCTADDRGSGADVAASPGPSPSPTPTPSAPDPAATSAALGEIPVRSADLADQPVVATVAPVGLALPSIDVTVPVEPVGVQADGQMEIPPMAEIAGWYRFGASPADADGTAVIAAHVDSVASEGLGPFARLRDVQAGDVVDVTLADGTVRGYTVTSVVRTPKPEVTWEDVFVRDGGHRLVLVTCGGTFQREVRSYSDNVIVTAEPRP